MLHTMNASVCKSMSDLGRLKQIREFEKGNERTEKGQKGSMMCDGFHFLETGTES